MGMPQHGAASGYYDKSALAQNMFASKQNAMAYGGYENANKETPSNASQTAAPVAAAPVPTPAPTKAKKGAGRGRKSKTTTPPTEVPTPAATSAYQGNSMHGAASHLQANQHAQLQSHGHQMGQSSGSTHGHQAQNAHHTQEAAAAAAAAAHHAQQQQGFQSYSNLKTAIAAASTTAGGGSSGSSADATAISLKTASMMPASAFNFGPTSTGPLGLYGESSGYLDDFRNPANHYYLPPSAQATDKTSGNATGGSNASGGASSGSSSNSSSAAAVAAATQSAAAYHQFLSHQQSRPAYPFMNSQLDPNSPIYQQFFQRRQEEIRAQMMLNQGLLGPHPGTPPGAYGQPGYHHPSLGMHKPPYDAMNRPSWL